MATYVWLIAGAGGMLGTALQRTLHEAGELVIAPDERAFDITDPATVDAAVGTFAATLEPGERGVVVNAAAFTDVERAEDEPERASAVNEGGARLLAEATRDAGLAFVHVSTDFVFDGSKDGAYTEDDEPAPLSAYGATKLAGERAVAAAMSDALIVRTAWVFGPAGANFPAKILAAARTRPSLSVVTDEVGSPTYTLDLARALAALARARATGLFHLAGAGSATRFELAAETLRLAGLDTPIEPVTAAAFPTKAARPANSVLACEKAAALGVSMRDWREALADYVSSGEAVLP